MKLKGTPTGRVFNSKHHHRRAEIGSAAQKGDPDAPQNDLVWIGLTQ